jgi:hypothetical protein
MHRNWFFTSQKGTIQHWAVIFGNEKKDWILADPTRLMKFGTFSSKVNILKTLSTVYQNKPKVKKNKQTNFLISSKYCRNKRRWKLNDLSLENGMGKKIMFELINLHDKTWIYSSKSQFDLVWIELKVKANRIIVEIFRINVATHY